MKNKEEKSELKSQNTKWTFTAEVYDEICKTIGFRKPEYGVQATEYILTTTISMRLPSVLLAYTRWIYRYAIK